MSAYEDAISAARDGLDDQYERNLKVDRACAEACVEAFLAALPPSIVVDGRVVELKPVARILAVEEHDQPYDSPSLIDHVADYYVERWLDAAREVANASSS